MPNIEEIKQQILPVKKGAPYIFVSYSSDDEDIVLPDVLELQKKGWNVWVDIHNVDKKQSTWTENAVKAIDNFYCKLVLFYASQTSLISENCYKELSHIDDDQTIENHINRSVPFIAIETEEIKDIKWYQNIIENNLNRSNYSPERINKHAKVLGNFLKNYFSTTNEKIRIHSRDTYENSEQYYKEIEEGILKDSEENYNLKNLTPEDIESLTSQRRKIQEDHTNLDIPLYNSSSSESILNIPVAEEIIVEEIPEDPTSLLLKKLKITQNEFSYLVELEEKKNEEKKWYKKLEFLFLSRLFIYRKPILIALCIAFIITCIVGYVSINVLLYNLFDISFDLRNLIVNISWTFLIVLSLILIVIRINYNTLVFKYHFTNNLIRFIFILINLSLLVSCTSIFYIGYRLFSTNFFLGF